MTNEYSSKAKEILVQYKNADFKPKPFISDPDEWHKKFKENREAGLKLALKQLTDLITQAQIEARIDELSAIQLGYGHQLAQTFINGNAMGVKERYEELQSTLKKEQ